jgi:multidrug resistance efflux pump
MESKGTTMMRLSVVLALVAIGLAFIAACHSSENPKADVVVNAPASGIVRSILVGDGAAIEKDAAIIEIAVTSQNSASQNEQSDKAAALARSDEIAAEAEAKRTTAELHRIEPLVKRGLASQSELDKARAQDQDSQTRLARARERVNSAGQQANQRSGVHNEEIVAVRAPATGRIREINVLAGQQVTAGQPLVRLSARS